MSDDIAGVISSFDSKGVPLVTAPKQALTRKGNIRMI